MPRRDDDMVCVACGRPYTRDHKCPPQVLAAMQSAATRIDREWDLDNDQLPPCVRDRRTLDERLAEGFAALEGYNDDE